MTQRKRHTSDFKAKVAMEAVKGQRTINEIASGYSVHPTQVSQWKSQLIEGASGVFGTDNGRAAREQEELTDRLYQQIGQLKVELDWLKKNLEHSIEHRRQLIDWDGELNLVKQCDLLGLSRSGVYYKPRPVNGLNLWLMRLIDEQYTVAPFYGVPRMTAWLGTQGHQVNRKRVRRLMREMGLEAIYPKPRTTIANPEHKVYPYLLRNMTIERVDQVWSTDITYIRMRHGFVYLVAVLDWFSRYVLSWRISNTIDGRFCNEALDDALQRGQPEIFNTDQGAQFTSLGFTSKLLDRRIAISMDGRGRALDNIFVERLWRSVKYEEVYLKDYERVADAVEGIGNYMTFYNERRLHQSLNYRTPATVYGLLA